jgi:hypothetical protein
VGPVVDALLDGVTAGITAPGRALRGEPVTYGDMLGTAGMAVTGSLPMRAPAGSLRSGALRSAGPAGQGQADEIMRLLRSGRGSEVTDEMMAAADQPYLASIYDLPLDEASRMRRAEEMGFRTGMPLYHGTASDFPAFSDSHLGRTTQAPTAAFGHWASRDPVEANLYADAAAALREGPSPARPLSESGPQVVPLFHRTDKPGAVSLDGTELELEVAGTLDDLWKDGYDAVLFRHSYPSINTHQKVVVRHPEQLRSRFARFDPRLSHLRNLSAGVGAAGLLTGLDPSLEDDTRSYLGAIYGQ